MRLTNILPVVALTTAFVIPDEQVLNSLDIEKHDVPATIFDRLPSKSDIIGHVGDAFKDAVALSENALDNALSAAKSAGKKGDKVFRCAKSMTAFDTQGWLDSAIDSYNEIDILDDKSEHPHHPHHPPHRKHPHHHKPNKTVYELINSSKYTTKLAKLINEFDDIVDILNGTAANCTVFAPTDKAFEKIPKHHGKPSKDLLKKILSYHLSPDFYPAGRVLVTHTIPTALGEDALGGAQRLRVGLGLKGLAVNFYSRIVAVNIFGTNGVIHGVDSLLLPPPTAAKIIELLPGEFSTLNLALEKTSLFKHLADNTTHQGGTLFAPSNFAFRKLGPRINAFLFSEHGEKYLKALLKYHIVANQTLYSDAFYKAKDVDSETDIDAEGIPKGYFHVDLPTLLEDKSLSIDVARYGGFITIKINGFATVAVADGIAKDGVVHLLSNVLIPPKTLGGEASELDQEMSVDELKTRLSPFTEHELEL